jgi:hypothetical protein
MTERITDALGNLRHKLTELLKLPDDTIIVIGQGNLSIYDINYSQETPVVAQIEFNEIYEVTGDSDDSA